MLACYIHNKFEKKVSEDEEYDNSLSDILIMSEWIFGSDRSSRSHNVCLSVLYKVLIKSLNLHLSSSDQ